MTTPPYTLGWVHNLALAPEDSDARGIIALAVVFPLLAVICVGLRFTIRITLGSVGWDDVALAFSCGLNIGYSATAIYQTRWGLGLRAVDFPPGNAVPFSRMQFVGGPLYCLTVLGFKLSLLISYLRVSDFNRVYATIVWIVIVSVVISQILFTILVLAGCRPIAKQWDPSLPGKCINALPVYFALGGTSLGWNLLIIILPFPILRRLQLERRRKVALLVVFSLGFFVTVVQAIRLASIARLATYTASEGSTQWSIIEINLGVIVACMPMFGPLVKRFRQKASGEVRSKASRLANSSPRKEDNDLSRLRTDMGGSWECPTVAEDEVELWALTNRILGGASRINGSTSGSRDGEDSKQSACQFVSEQQISVQQDIL
ncbi:hypothetical protein D6D17_00158 [Aureobasidium pullulans]|nr:hypothetical protein D6D17_00158 [Aureobasidium pullulans]